MKTKAEKSEILSRELSTQLFRYARYLEAECLRLEVLHEFYPDNTTSTIIGAMNNEIEQARASARRLWDAKMVVLPEVK